MLAYDFMQNALIAGVLIATICGIVSVFVVIRRTAFATHALGHISLTGAAGAGLIGVSTITGQLVANIVAAIIMGLLGDKIKKNDLNIGVVLTFFLGLGAYFLFLFQNNYAGSVMSILFGNILSVSTAQIQILALLSAVIIVVFLVCARPLLFASIDATLAEAKRVPIRLLSTIFFLILAITISMACQVVGTLLIFALLIIPGAVANQWCDGFYKSIIVSIVTANFAIIGSLLLAFYYDLPVSFCITMLMSISYSIGYFKSYFLTK
jgi:zinc/manganese transport system permease protein